MTWDPRITQCVSQQPYPLLFMTISGAHLYGFPSPDSDYDLRGIHLLPLEKVLGLQVHHETIERTQVVEGLELDLVTHDAKSAFNMLLKKSGNVLESLFSPLVVTTSPGHEELKAIAPGCITRHYAHHYLGFAENQWKLFEKENPRRVKPLLYTFRVLMTGITLMRTGKVEANIMRLNQTFHLPYVENLVIRKLAGPEQSTLKEADVEFYREEYVRLQKELETAHAETTLPENPTNTEALNDLLVRLRMQ
ncbi:MAG: putative nucleotidyltransferase [Planctomycetaceae bacterium]|nr:putative nucleotidyltransferase [Planctomycetaceae bacterium]